MECGEDVDATDDCTAAVVDDGGATGGEARSGDLDRDVYTASWSLKNAISLSFSSFNAPNESRSF